MSMAEVVERMPEIPWTEPVVIKKGAKEGYACRLCIYEAGGKIADVEAMSLGDARVHTSDHYDRVTKET